MLRNLAVLAFVAADLTGAISIVPNKSDAALGASSLLLFLICLILFTLDSLKRT